MLKDLDHPHILRVSELYVDERNYHMVTELCEGSDLFDKIQQS